MKSTINISPTGWPTNSQMRMQLPPGDAGIRLTIAAMLAIAHDSVHSASVRALAATIKADAERAGQHPGEAVYWYCRRHVQFARDPNGVEKLTTPEQMIAIIQREGIVRADCDELATLAVSLLRIMGKPPLLIVMATRPRKPYHHVFFGVHDYKAGAGGPLAFVIPFDPQERIAPGQWHDNIARIEAFNV